MQMKPIGRWNVGTFIILLCVLNLFAGYAVLLVDRQASRFTLYVAGALSGASLVLIILCWRRMKLPGANLRSDHEADTGE